ncbi:carbohydrate ABC transporter permease [Jiangella mangrovi]|uniref:Multiple sugar transport system permease protein/raffinose/stachyose/melibiose transport system permease protein n=1 Tax=Jiangella mangrovi TaxID=1524084 RepID=A0A7W9LNC6_9ACTN|nr:sugar ABC transporter permease [Jiangella mangrovi]MBB5790109.1 multiple sugar transport system permease protein/raffinose/stachyose/melibiose transport system permease protein [Jiangella mangrovi]
MRQVLGSKRAVALLLGPALLVYIGVMIVPVVWSLVYSFFTGNVIQGFDYVGVDNFTRLFDDPVIHSALWFTVKYALVRTAGQIVLGYLLALLYVFVLRRSSSLIRTLVFFPVVLPSVAIGLLFSKFFGTVPQEGPINAFLGLFGVSQFDWFASGGTAFWVIIIMDLWTTMGFYAVLLYAGLIEIPQEVIESARMDGVRSFSMFRYIVLPMSLPVLLSSIIFSLNSSLKVFDSIVALTNGGPGTATTPLNLYMFQTSFLYSDYGYGSTIALLITVLCLAVTLLIFRSSRRDLTQS